ncbi:MAG: hypothetical protein HQ534_05550 [Armatimonadetes bacterium]|nr:hypothetical protein [Armatimonadota bacterium]
MKRFKLLLILSFLLILLIGCEKDSKKNVFETDFPLFGGNGAEDIETIMMVTSLDVNSDAWISLYTMNEPITWMLEINGIQVNFTWELLEEWVASIFVEGMCAAGETMTYIFELNGETFSGDLTIPHFPIVNWPSFNFNEDYEFTWTLTQNTDVQMIDFGIETFDDDFVETWLIDGADRSFEIDKNNYEDYQNNCEWIGIYLHPINFSIFDETLIFSLTFAGANIEEDRELDIKKIAKTIMKNR